MMVYLIGYPDQVKNKILVSFVSLWFNLISCRPLTSEMSLVPSWFNISSFLLSLNYDACAIKDKLTQIVPDYTMQDSDCVL